MIRSSSSRSSSSRSQQYATTISPKPKLGDSVVAKNHSYNEAPTA
jgi:hypothetical protein